MASYLGSEGDAADPLVFAAAGAPTSPTCRRPSCSPPASIRCADEGQAYARRLEAAGVPTEYRCHESMIHGFVSITGLIENAEAGLADAAAALRAAFGRNEREGATP